MKGKLFIWQGIKPILIFVIVLVLSGIVPHSILGQSVSIQDNRILIYDGKWDERSDYGSFFLSLLHAQTTPDENDEIKSVRKQILAKSSQIKDLGLETMKSIEPIKTSVNCKKFGKDQIILSVANGAFTKPNEEQTAYLYKLYMCHEDKEPKEEYADTVGGIAIVENGKIDANYVYAGSKFSKIEALPDINQNGLSEIILAREYNDIDVAEIIENKIAVYCSFNEVHSYHGGLDGFPYIYDSKKIYVVPGKNPEFFEESYYKRGSDEWKLSKPLEKVSLASPKDWSGFFRLVK